MFLTLLLSAFVLLALSIPGFILQKTNRLQEGSIKTLSEIYLKVGFPFLTLTALLNAEYEPKILANMGIIALLTVVMTVVGYFLAKFIFSFFKSQEEFEKRACIAGAFLGNSGFIGIPLFMMIFPNDPVPILYSVAAGIPGNIALFTLVIFELSGDKKFVSLKQAFLNPPTLVLVIGLPLFFLHVHLPDQVLNAMTYLAHLCAPLSMIVIGIRLAQAKNIFSAKKVYLSIFIKLVLLPLVMFLILLLCKTLFNLDEQLMVVFLLICSMPAVGSLCSLADLSGGDSAAAAKITLLSTLFCVITLPLIILLTYLF